YALMPRNVGKIVRNTEVTEYLELNRMWLDDHAPHNSESRAIAYMIKFIKRACPAVKWIQSFADERCGRLGVVYQAANFLFLGSHKTRFYELEGESYHSMLLTAHKKGGKRGEYLRENLHRANERNLRQLRYIYFIKPKYRRDLVMRPQPYPKPSSGI
ncbi:Mom family adenine methylcarbamoylation protein, partial [Insolitispirillum peregrinum]